MQPSLGVAARTLALDLTTGEVVRALDGAGIYCMLLKGPVLARRLYGNVPGIRNYGDIDLLVPPENFGGAGRVLASLGFEDDRKRIRASEAARLQARPWRRSGDTSVTVDLHRGFHYVIDRSAWWDLLSQHRETILVEGQRVAIPGRAGCAAITALHAARPGSPAKPVEDLCRALALFDDEVWRQAADLAAAVGAAGAFAAALSRQSAGAELAAHLGLAVSDQVGWFSAISCQRGTEALSFTIQPASWAVRAQRMRDVAFPSRAALSGGWPMAARGQYGLAAVYLGRLCVLAARLPSLLLAWHRASRARHRSSPPAARRARRDATHGRCLRIRPRAIAGTSWWTLRMWWRVHRGLDGDIRRRGVRAAPALLPAPPTAHSRRAAQLTLACCQATCLERALLRQARAAGAGIPRDVIVGVTAPATGFRAHAWLDGDQVEPGLVELWRYPADTTVPSGQPRRVAS
jgi:hypothetical protein